MHRIAILNKTCYERIIPAVLETRLRTKMCVIQMNKFMVILRESRDPPLFVDGPA